MNYKMQMCMLLQRNVSLCLADTKAAQNIALLYSLLHLLVVIFCAACTYIVKNGLYKTNAGDGQGGRCDIRL